MSKSAVAVVVDIGPSMAEDGKLERAKKALQLILNGQMLHKKRDEVSVILVGTRDTQNPMADEMVDSDADSEEEEEEEEDGEEDGAFNNITVFSEMGKPTLDLLRRVNDIETEDSTGDIFEALLVAFKVITDRVKKLKFAKSIVLLTDAQSPTDYMDDEQSMQDLVDGFRENDVFLNIIGLGISDQELGMEDEYYDDEEEYDDEQYDDGDSSGDESALKKKLKGESSQMKVEQDAKEAQAQEQEGASRPRRSRRGVKDEKPDAADDKASTRSSAQTSGKSQTRGGGASTEAHGGEKTAGTAVMDTGTERSAMFVKNTEQLCKLREKLQNNCFAHTGNVGMNVLESYQSRAVSQTTKTRGYLHIGDQVKVAVRVYTKVRRATRPTLKKRVVRKLRSGEVEQGEEVKQARVYFTKTDGAAVGNATSGGGTGPQTAPSTITSTSSSSGAAGQLVESTIDESEVPPEDLIKGFRYGDKVVPVAAMDEVLMKFTAEKGLWVLGFGPKNKVDPFLFSAGVDCMVSDPGSYTSHAALSALVHACYEMQQVMFVKYVFRNNADPKLMVCYPVVVNNDDEAYEAFHMLHMPFEEDLRTLRFRNFFHDAAVASSGAGVSSPSQQQQQQQQQQSGQPANTVTLPSQSQLLAMRGFLRSCDLQRAHVDEYSGEATEALDPAFTVNPHLQRFYRSVPRRALNPSDPLEDILDRIPQDLSDILQVPQSVRESKEYAGAVEQLGHVLKLRAAPKKEWKGRRRGAAAGASGGGEAKTTGSKGSSAEGKRRLHYNDVYDEHGELKMDPQLAQIMAGVRNDRREVEKARAMQAAATTQGGGGPSAASGADADSGAAAASQTENKDASPGADEQESQGVDKVSINDPSGSFAAMMARTDVDVRQVAVEQLQGIITNMIRRSFGRAAYPRALKLLLVMRTECEKVQEAHSLYNISLRALRGMYMKRKADLWKKIQEYRNGVLTPIGYTPSEAANFFAGLEKASTQGTLLEVSNEDAEDAAEDDDLLMGLM